jgi:hypothetical protein
MRHGVEQSAQNARSCDLEFAPKLALGSPLRLANRW